MSVYTFLVLSVELVLRPHPSYILPVPKVFLIQVSTSRWPPCTQASHVSMLAKACQAYIRGVQTRILGTSTNRARELDFSRVLGKTSWTSALLLKLVLLNIQITTPSTPPPSPTSTSISLTSSHRRTRRHQQSHHRTHCHQSAMTSKNVQQLSCNRGLRIVRRAVLKD